SWHRPRRALATATQSALATDARSQGRPECMETQAGGLAHRRQSGKRAVTGGDRQSRWRQRVALEDAVPAFHWRSSTSIHSASARGASEATAARWVAIDRTDRLCNGLRAPESSG